jgi:hypothetical protein
MTLMSLIALLGCPPSTDVQDTSDTSDTEADADTDADTDTDTDADSDAPHSVAIFATSDYSTGALAELNLTDGTLVDTRADIASDAAVSVSGGTVYGLGRSGANYVRAYTPGEYGSPTLEFGVGEGANPQSAKVCAGSLFVSLYALPHLAIYNTETGVLEGTVDLSAYADADGSPEAAGMVQHGDTLFVALNNLDTAGSWGPAGDGHIVQVDCATASVTDGWAIGANVSISDWPGRDNTLVARTGVWGEYDDEGVYHSLFDGEVLVLDTAAGTLSDAKYTETDANLWWFGMGPGDTGVAFTSNADWSYSAWCVDASADEWQFSELINTYNFLSGGGISNTGVALVGESVYDQDFNPAGGLLHWYDLTSDCAEGGASPVETTYFPTSVSFY